MNLTPLNPFRHKAAPKVTLADLGKRGAEDAKEPTGRHFPQITMTGPDTDTDKSEAKD